MYNFVTRILGAAFVLMAVAQVTSVYAEEWMDLPPLSAKQLESASGRQGIPVQWQFNQTEQSAQVSGNSLWGPVATGDNRISDDAFGNMSGIATVIQNTGNQVVIQDSTQINILINQ